MKHIAFFGHRKIYKENEIKQRLTACIEEKIADGFTSFIVGTHGEFDKIVLSVLRALRTKYLEIEINVVFTSLSLLKRDKYGDSISDLYKDVQTSIYDFEDKHFKRQIIYTNRKMVEDCDLVVCYVDMQEYYSGAKRAVNYAKQKGKDIINLYQESDKPFYGMTEEERKTYWENVFKKK